MLEILTLLGYSLYIGLNRVPSSVEKQFPDYLMVALKISAIVFAICVFLLCVFQIIYIYNTKGIKGILIIVVTFAIVFTGAFLFNKILLEEEKCLRHSIILSVGFMSLVLIICSCIRIRKEK